MYKFVFTGPAMVNGLHIERKFLIALAKEQGHQVQNKVDNTTDYLVMDGDILGFEKGTKKLKAYMKPGNVNTMRITSNRFLKKMGFL